MKLVTVIGAVLLLLGILSFVVPLPHREEHSVKVGDTKWGVQTQTSERLPLAASIVIVAAGVACLIAGSRKA
jgi:uncharacterized BrkB/YihY/UPF0761 family membrane protein